MKLTDEDIDTLTSYADGEFKVMVKLRCSLTELIEAALNENVERCPHCKWWAESHEMIPDGSDDPDGRCLNCR